jgi:creatinine amidohydrolase
MEEKVEYERLLPAEFSERFEAFPVVYVPVGSLEWHGEHMALGNDSLKMHALCCEAARLGGGIVYPAIYYCIPGLAPADPSRYKHDSTFWGEPEVLRTLLLSTLQSLEKVGFRVAILTTGHTPPQQVQMMRDVAGEYQGKMHIHGTCDMDFGDEINFTSDHGAMWETSILWQAFPGLVDLTLLDPDPEVKPFNVFGKDPRTEASPGLGKRAIQTVARDMAALAGKLLAEQAPEAK